MKSHFELSPGEYEARRQGHLQRRRLELLLRDLSAARPGELVVDVGCGPGDVLGSLARARGDLRFFGVDVDRAMIEHARERHGRPNVTFELADPARERLDLDARLVFGIDVLHHVHELGAFVAAVARLLQRDGTWTAIEPNSRNPYIWLHQERMRRAGLDEVHFDREAFEREAARSRLRIRERSTAFVVPGAVQSVPGAVARLERVLERVPRLGGSVVYRLAPA